jgi:hypothetical protein
VILVGLCASAGLVARSCYVHDRGLLLLWKHRIRQQPGRAEEVIGIGRWM